jgi:hypothetical protein
VCDDDDDDHVDQIHDGKKTMGGGDGVVKRI